MLDRTSSREDILWQAAVLAFPVIGLEQVLHTTLPALAAEPDYQALHWFSDALMALPLAAAAVWSGHLLARRSGHRTTSFIDNAAHGLIIVFLFALLLVPGALLHDEADRLTHAHAQLAIHSHGTSLTQAPATPDNAIAYLGHAFQDGLVGQAVGLPLLLLALLARARGRRRLTIRGESAPSQHQTSAARTKPLTIRLIGDGPRPFWRPHKGV